MGTSLLLALDDEPSQTETKMTCAYRALISNWAPGRRIRKYGPPAGESILDYYGLFFIFLYRFLGPGRGILGLMEPLRFGKTEYELIWSDLDPFQPQLVNLVKLAELEMSGIRNEPN